jgi:hypothetical protein
MNGVEEGAVHTSGARFFVNWIGWEGLLGGRRRKYLEKVFIGQCRMPNVGLGVLQREGKTRKDLLNSHERYGPDFK